jgi:glutathione S-transferase
MFAEECGVHYDFQVVSSLLAVESDDYGGNPGLRLPNLVTSDGAAFGSLPGCRLIASMRPEPVQMVWPEQTPPLLASNAMELTVQAMSTEVSLIMVSATGGDSSRYAEKLRAALVGMIAWLDQNISDALIQLPACDLSYLELSLFCLVDHLEFRDVMSIEPYRHLRAFRDRFAERPSATATPFTFDN